MLRSLRPDVPFRIGRTLGTTSSTRISSDFLFNRSSNSLTRISLFNLPPTLFLSCGARLRRSQAAARPGMTARSRTVGGHSGVARHGGRSPSHRRACSPFAEGAQGGDEDAGPR